MMGPELPSQAEVEEHSITHLPFRCWCRHCVRGRGRAADHRTQDREDGLLDFHVDYCFLSSADSPNKYMAMLISASFGNPTCETWWQ